MRVQSDSYFKLLFAIQIAILPLIVLANMLVPVWLPLMFFVLILVARLWSTAYFNKSNFQHYLLTAIADFCTISFCFIFSACLGSLPWGIVIVAIIVCLAYLFMTVFTYDKVRSDIIIAFDFSFYFFIYISILLIFISVATAFWAQAAMTSAIIVALMSGGYKLYKVIIAGKRDNKSDRYNTNKKKEKK